MKILRIIGQGLVAVGLVAVLAEILDYPLLIYYGDPIGGVLGIGGIFIGVTFITIATIAPEVRSRKPNLLELYTIFVDTFNEKLGTGVGWLTTVMVVVVFVNVVLRYVFGQSYLALQDMSWYVFGTVFLIGAAYTLRHDRHVRVDIFYVKYPPKVKVWVDLLGSIFLLIPFCILGLYVSGEFVERSFAIQETSPDAGGLAARYLAKSTISLGFILLLLQGISLIFRSILQLRGKLSLPEEESGPTAESPSPEQKPALSSVASSPKDKTM